MVAISAIWPMLIAAGIQFSGRPSFDRTDRSSEEIAIVHQRIEERHDEQHEDGGDRQELEAPRDGAKRASPAS